MEENRAPVGQPIRHISALHQCTGEAKYVDDIPDGRGCLHSAFVLSEKPHARLVSVDASAALAEPGVVRFFSAKDVSQDQNLWGPILQDEEVFRRDTVLGGRARAGRLRAKGGAWVSLNIGFAARGPAVCPSLLRFQRSRPRGSRSASSWPRPWSWPSARPAW